MLISLSQHPFCVAFAERREALGLSLRSLSDKLGTSSRSYLREIEAGLRCPSFEMGLLIAQYLQIPLYFVVDYIEEFEQLKIYYKRCKDYTEWFDSLPNHIQSEFLSNSSSQQAHTRYYKKEDINE